MQGEYLKNKQRQSELPRKYCVKNIGKQEDATWVLGENVHLSSSGEMIPPSESGHMWLGSLYSGVGIADVHKCSIKLPLSSEPLKVMLEEHIGRGRKKRKGG